MSCERAGGSFQLPKSKATSAVWMSAWILPPWRSLQHQSCKMSCHHLIARWSLHLPKEVSFQQLGSSNSSLSSYLCRLMAHVDLNLKFQNPSPRHAPPGPCLIILCYLDGATANSVLARFTWDHTAHPPRHESMQAVMQTQTTDALISLAWPKGEVFVSSI